MAMARSLVGALLEAVSGCEGDNQVAAVVFPSAAGAGNADYRPLRQPLTLMWQQRRVGGDDNDYGAASAGSLARLGWVGQGDCVSRQVPSDQGAVYR